MTLIHLVRTFRQGGMENGVANLVNHLDSQRFRSVIYVMADADAFVQRVHDPSRVVVLNQRHGNDPIMIVRLARRFCRVRPTIVHTHGWGTLLEGLLAARLARVPVVVHGEHGTIEMRRRNRWVQQRAWPLATQVLSVSENHRQTLAETIGVPTTMIKAIPNGVDLTPYRALGSGQALRSQYQIPPDHLVIGSVGRLVEVKQYHRFIQVLASLRRQHETLHGVLIGEGDCRDELTALARQLGMQDRLHFLGYQDCVPDLLNMMDIFLQTSRSEGMPNTILEAMATGLPVVATDVGGTNELVVDGETGILVSPRNVDALAKALDRLITDVEIRQHMGRQARKRVEDRFTLATMVRAYEALYLQLAADRYPASRVALPHHVAPVLGGTMTDVDSSEYGSSVDSAEGIELTARQPLTDFCRRVLGRR